MTFCVRLVGMFEDVDWNVVDSLARPVLLATRGPAGDVSRHSAAITARSDTKYFPFSSKWPIFICRGEAGRPTDQQQNCVVSSLSRPPDRRVRTDLHETLRTKPVLSPLLASCFGRRCCRRRRCLVLNEPVVRAPHVNNMSRAAVPSRWPKIGKKKKHTPADDSTAQE